MRDKIFYTICFGFILGVLVRSLFSINIYTALFFGVVALGLVIFYSVISKNKWGILAGLFVLVFALGIMRFHQKDTLFPAVFESSVGQKVTLTGIIVDEPDRRENNQKLVVSVQDGKEKTKILASVGLENDFQYGDQVELSGGLEHPENFVTDQGKEFDYVNYLKKDGILYVMGFPKVKVLSSGNGAWIKSFLFSVKEKFLEKVNLQIPAPENILLGGLILGEKSSFDNSMRQNFVNTGTIHIVALSGYNVTIVAEWIMKLFKSLPHSFGVYLGILAIFLFIIMTGASSTAIRAGIMATLALFARATGRNYDVARALILAGVGMVFLNPMTLVYDVSFQLSFIATLALIFFTPRIEKYFLWVPDKFKLRDIVSTTVAVYIFVMPFILYKMGNLSLVALPANVLILPLISFTMLFGFLAGFAGFLSPLLSLPFGYLSYLLLHYELSVVNFFAGLPFASLTIPNFPLLITILIYLYLINLVFGRSIRKFFIR